jgi:aspartyl-tRNA(Asn)/glutamyl-tRNA(Gln) amidotransferase subunit B
MESQYETVIGLEVHVQLNTETKIFCNCSTSFGAEPNTQTCPVCLGMPGVLPVLNEKALEKGIKAGLSLNGTIANYSKFDRKNYFYPDLPKAYQISQFDKPISSGGHLEVELEGETKRIGITRLHLEEDAGKSIHSDRPGDNTSSVDLNRTGVPLAEIVSEPDMRSADEAYLYLQKLKSIMKYIDVSDVNMEEGSLRCDVNISLRPWGETKLGEKVEIKNLNSFKAVKSAILYEEKRQAEKLQKGEKILQETRLWDTDYNETYSMRSKEDAHDYRYFPDPDLTPIILEDSYIESLRQSLPELPDDKKERFVKEFSLPAYDADVLTSVRQLADYFESTVKEGVEPKQASNFIMSELMGKLDDPETIDSFPVTYDRLAGLLKLVSDDTISGKIAKKVFGEMLESPLSAQEIVDQKGLKQVTDTGAIEAMVDKVIGENQTSVDDYKNGKGKALGFLVGQVMKESKGTANPQMVNKLLAEKISRG